MATSGIVWLRRWGIPIVLSVGALGLGQYIRVSSVHNSHYVTDVQANQLQRVQVSGSEVAFLIENRSGKWVMDRQPEKQLDDIAIRDWIDRIRSVEIIRDVTGVSPTDSGLNRPVFTVRWDDRSGRSETLALGGKAPSGEVYLKKGNQVVLVSAVQAMLIRVDNLMLRDRYPFKQIPIQHAVRVRVDTPTSRFSLVKTPVTGWWWIQPISGRPYLADPVAVTRYLQIVNGVGIQAFQSIPPDGIPWQVRVETPTRDLRIVCRALLNSGTAMLLPSGEWGITSPAFRLATLGFEAWIPGAKPVRFDRFQLNQVSVSTSKNNVVLFRNESGHWMGTAAQPPKTTALHNFFAGMAELAVTQNQSANVVRDWLDLRVQSDQGSERYRVTQVRPNEVIITPLNGPFLGQSITLSGDIDRVWRAIHKLTTTQ